MFDKFEISKDISPNLKNKLKSIWNTEYAELYDDLYFPDADLSHQLEQDINDLFELRNDDKNLLYEKNFYIGLSLCKAVSPMLKGYLSNEQLSSVNKFLNLIDRNDRELLNTFSDFSFGNEVPGAVVESICVYQSMKKLIESKETGGCLSEMIDSCIIGSGICPGHKDKRAILNWFIIDVFPSSELLKTSCFTYSVETKLANDWKYTKA